MSPGIRIWIAGLAAAAFIGLVLAQNGDWDEANVGAAIGMGVLVLSVAGAIVLGLELLWRWAV